MSDRRKTILKKTLEPGVETPTKQVRLVLNEENTNVRKGGRMPTQSKRYTDDSFEEYHPENFEQAPLRRSTRKSIQNLKYSDEHYEQPKRIQRKECVVVSAESSSEDSDQKNDENITYTQTTKISDLLFEDKDVAGKKLFGFHTPKRRTAMAQKVSEVVNSPAFSTPKSTTKDLIVTKTPHAVRSKMRKEIEERIEEHSDFSDSGSDFKPSGESSSEESSENESKSESDSDSSDNEKQKKITLRPTSKLTQNTRTTRGKRDITYTMKTDDYFASQTTKILTSNHTLQKLKNPKLSEHQLQEILKVENLTVSKKHEKSIQNLFDTTCHDFSQWMTILNEGFSILLYGLGSKRNILTQFHQELLEAKFPVLVVNGYFPSLTIKDILDTIYVDLLEHKESSNIFETVDLIREDFERMPNLHFYLIIHNIEGEMLRNSKSQNVLASLAVIPNIHLVTSVDHINTPLIWDHSRLGKFNFIWWDATSFLPYTDETSFESSLLVQKSGALVLSSMSSVYQSLTKNSKGIFMLIVKYQLSKKDEKHYQGMPFKTLYSQCRENFLVSSDLALRAQLTEFLDHKLVRSKRTSDGTEQLTIPIHNSILQQYCEEVTN